MLRLRNQNNVQILSVFCEYESKKLVINRNWCVLYIKV